jgi:hypothetical protein
MHLPCISERIDDGYLKLRFDWVVFERPIALLSVQAIAEVGTEEYELTGERNIGEGREVHQIPAYQGMRFLCVVPLACVLDLDPDFTVASSAS